MFLEFSDGRHVNMVRLLSVSTGRLNPTQRYLALISVRD